MARGWESKSIEAQQEEHGRKGRTPSLTTEQRERAARRETLALQRARAAADLSRATKPGHRAMLEQAINEIDRQLRDIDGEPR